MKTLLDAESTSLAAKRERCRRESELRIGIRLGGEYGAFDRFHVRRLRQLLKYRIASGKIVVRMRPGEL